MRRDDMRVWQLRPDLELIPAESEDGGPAFLVNDPVSGRFDRVEWPESDLLELLRQPVSLEKLREEFKARTTLKPDDRDIRSYLAELGKKGWLRGSLFWQSGYREQKKKSWPALLAKLLVLQLPLVRPARFLAATAGIAKLLGRPVFLAVLVFCGVLGVYLTLPRWEEYWQDSLGRFEITAIPAFFIALVIVKAAHEFAHAYVATWAGARVASMGVAFFFFMPLPFTDVTDAWRLGWTGRLRVASAGMVAEIGIAAVALLGWALSPPGAAAIALARLSSVAVVSTLLVNLNPGPRFDGYYILVCLFRIENLRARSSELLRRTLDQIFLGKQSLPTDSRLTGKKKVGLIAFAAYAVVYRFGLGCAFAAMAYTFLPKAVGLPLAAAMLWLFIGMPVLREAARVFGVVRQMAMNGRLVLTGLLLVAVLAWFALPLPRRVSFAAVTRAETEEVIRTRAAGEVFAITVGGGERVTGEKILLELVSPLAEVRERQAEWALVESELSEEQAWRGVESRRETALLAAETQQRRVELAALRQRRAFLEVRSPTDGVLTAWDRTMRPGLVVPSGKAIGWVTDGRVSVLSCYAPVAVAGKLDVGNIVKFVPDSGNTAFSGRITNISQSRPEILQDSELAIRLGAVADRGDSYFLREPYTRIEVSLDGDVGRSGQTGTVWTRTRPESLLVAAWRWLGSLAVRESSF